MPLRLGRIRKTLLASIGMTVLLAPAVAASNSEYGSFLAGQHAEALRDTDRAAAFMLRVLEENPDDQKLLRRTFILSLTAGKMETAVSLAQRIEGAGGKMSTAAMLLATGLIATGVCRGIARHPRLLEGRALRLGWTVALAAAGLLLIATH